MAFSCITTKSAVRKKRAAEKPTSASKTSSRARLSFSLAETSSTETGGVVGTRASGGRKTG
jgi:hypothetical protein